MEEIEIVCVWLGSYNIPTTPKTERVKKTFYFKVIALDYTTSGSWVKNGTAVYWFFFQRKLSSKMYNVKSMNYVLEARFVQSQSGVVGRI